VSGKVDTRFLIESDYPCWNALVEASPDGSIYSTPEYLDVLCSETNGRFRILVAERGGEMLGGIALFERDGVCGTYVMGRTLLYYSGFVLKRHDSKYPSQRTSRELACLGTLEERLRSETYGRVRIKSRSTVSDVRTFVDRGWTATLNYTYLVSIADLNACRERVEQNLRRLCNRCSAQNVQFADDDDIDSFIRLHEQTSSRRGIREYLPADRFRRYFQRLHAQQLCRVFHARTAEGRVMSSQIVLLGRHPVCHTVSAAADPEFLSTGATAWLRCKSFERLNELGYKANDLTDAHLNSVTHFKSQLGGDLQVTYVLSLPDNMRFRTRDALLSAASSAKRAAAGILRRTKPEASS
jgi:hypothetical protein